LNGRRVERPSSLRKQGSTTATGFNTASSQEEVMAAIVGQGCIPAFLLKYHLSFAGFQLCRLLALQASSFAGFHQWIACHLKCHLSNCSYHLSSE
jgi:hypothetical protein